MVKRPKLQFVWPKDGYKGRSGRRGFCSGLNDILEGRGPDIFLQRKGSSTPIKPDFWGNWDSYHDPHYHREEAAGSYHNGLWNASRGTKRYDPHSRRYKEWSVPHDWYGHRIGANNEPYYPRFTREESDRMMRRYRRGGQIIPRKMGSDWHHDGPKRFQQENDWFWQNAHRVGENVRQGFHPNNGINPHLRMHQRWPDDVYDWVRAEPWY